MKELYYSSASINQQAKLFFKRLLLLRDNRKFSVKKNRVALIVTDCQRFFFDDMSQAYIPSADAILPKIMKLQECCFQSGIKVIQTRHGNTKANVGMMDKWWSGHLIERDDPLSEIVHEVQDKRAIVVEKSQYDAFYNTDLDGILRTNGIEQLIITGVMTHLCCESTARAAFARGYEVFFAVDGTATYNKEFHMSALTNLTHGFVVPVLIEDVIKKLKQPIKR